MEYTKENFIVKAWLRLIKNGVKTLNDVPNIFNLRDVLIEQIKKEGGSN